MNTNDADGQDANALMLGEFPVVMELVAKVEGAKEAKQQVELITLIIIIKSSSNHQ